MGLPLQKHKPINNADVASDATQQLGKAFFANCLATAKHLR
jgi:hypothetical protein